MSFGEFTSEIRGAFRSAKLSRSMGDLSRLGLDIPTRVPARRDITLLELRRITPALLRLSHNADLRSKFVETPDEGRRHFRLVKGLIVAQAGDIQTPEALETLARAVLAIRFGWALPSPIKSVLLRPCEDREWMAVSPELALKALHKAFRLRRSMAIWRRILSTLSTERRWDDICEEARLHPIHNHLAAKALESSKMADTSERLLAAELIALARCHEGDRGRELARRWLLQLVSCSTERFMKRTFAARVLCEQLLSHAHVSPPELARAIELGIKPAGDEDYSNFREAFAPKTWPCLHQAFISSGILTELERFACELDRCRFWEYIDSKDR